MGLFRKMFHKKSSQDDEKVHSRPSKKIRDKTLRHSKSMPLGFGYSDPYRPNKAVWMPEKGPLKKDNIVLVLNAGAAISTASRYADEITFIPRGRAPHPPTPTTPRAPTPPPKEPRKQRSKDLRRQMHDQFPNPGGKRVEQALVFRPPMRGPEPSAPLPEIPQYRARVDGMPVLGSRNGIPAKELLPENRTLPVRHKPSHSQLEIAREAEEIARLHQRSASDNIAFPTAQPTNHRAWAVRPKVPYDESRDSADSRIFYRHHQHTTSNPVMPSQDLRNRMKYGSAVAREMSRPTPPVQQAPIVPPPSRGFLGAEFEEEDYGTVLSPSPTSTAFTHTNAPNHTFPPTPPLNIRPRAGSNKVKDNNGAPAISSPLPLQPHVRNGSGSSYNTLGHSNHGYSSSNDSTRSRAAYDKDYKDYPPSARDRHERRNIVRVRLGEQQLPQLEFGYNGGPPGLRKSGSLPLGHKAREHRREY